MISNDGFEVVIVVHGDSKKPMEFVDHQFVYARRKVKTYLKPAAINMMRLSRYYRKMMGFSPTPYEIMKLV